MHKQSHLLVVNFHRKYLYSTIIMLVYIDPILRGILFLFLIITLGLTGSLIANSNHENPQVNFGLFAAVFGLVFGVFYGIAAGFIKVLAFPIAIATIDFLNFVFTFAGATAIAAAIKAHSCSNQDYLDNNTVTQGSSDRCRKAQASVAFLYFAFFLTIGQLVLSVGNVLNSGPFTLPFSKRASPPRTGVPSSAV